MKKFTQVDEGIFDRSKYDLYDIFEKFNKSKENHMNDVVRMIANAVDLKEETTSISEKVNIQRYIDALHQYRNAIKDLPANLMTENIIKQKNKISENKNLQNLEKTGLQGNYLVKYQVVNRKGSVGEWTSPEYQFIVSDNTSESARAKFVDMWYEEFSAIQPMPVIEIVSVSNNITGKVDNKLRAY